MIIAKKVYRMTIRAPLLLVLAIFITWFGLGAGCLGCIFDPQPEPDPMGQDGGAGGWSGNGSSEEDQGGGEPTDNADGYDTASSADTEYGVDVGLPDKEKIYCSAPGPDDMVTAVGLKGAVQDAQSVLVFGQSGVVRLDVSEDGSFAGRIKAQEGEQLKFVVAFPDTDSEGVDGVSVDDIPESDVVAVPAGTRDRGFVGNNIVGSGSVSTPNAEDQVSVFGRGNELETEYVVIGGNLTLSLGRETLVSCTAGCRFELFIPGQADNEIDLFLVLPGERFGRTDSQTVFVPSK